VCNGTACTADAMRSFVAQANWVGAIVLEAVVAAIALSFALAAIIAGGRKVGRSWEWWLVLAVGAVAVAFDVHVINAIAKFPCKPGEGCTPKGS